MSAEEGLQLLFPTVIQVTDVPEAEVLNRQLAAEIEAVRATQPNSKPSSWACDLYTTIGAPQVMLKRPGMQRFLALAHERVEAYATAMRFDVERQRPRIHECWINAYGSQQAQEIHLHRNSVFSGIYFVSAPEGSGATLFYSPLSDSMLEPRPTEGNQLNAKVSGFAPVAGRMLLFRSHLRHSVMPGSAMDSERITIAFNAIM